MREYSIAERVAMRLPDGLNSIERALIALVAEIAWRQAGEPGGDPGRAASAAMELVRRIAAVLPDRRAVADILPTGAQHFPVMKAIGDAIYADQSARRSAA